MVFEQALMTIREGVEDEFAEGFGTIAAPIFAQAEGFVSVELQRCEERPSVFLLRVGWESVEAHTERFRGSELFTQWRAFANPYFAEPPSVEHFAPVPGSHISSPAAHIP